MHTKLIRLLLGLLCLCVSGLTFGQTGLQALQLSDWGYPTGYTATGDTIIFNSFSGDASQQPLFHIHSRFPALSFLVGRTNGTAASTTALRTDPYQLTTLPTDRSAGYIDYPDSLLIQPKFGVYGTLPQF